MKEYIIEEYERYKKEALMLNDVKFTNDVLKSFKDAKTHRHYVLLVPCNLDEYYTTEEHNIMSENGYYQQTNEGRYDNTFFIPNETIENAAEILRNENMFVEKTKVNETPTYVISLNGINDTYFRQDYCNNVSK